MSTDLLMSDPLLRGNVQRGLDLLAERLEPVIAARLAPNLGGLPWTEVLNQLDVMKGRAARYHAAIDLQSQLRMLTERLGGLGYPFDDERRNVSRLGSELRLVRNSLAHGGTFAPVDAWRAHDSASRLLSVIGDTEGADACAGLRDSLTGLLPGVAERPQADVEGGDDATRAEPEFELEMPPTPAPRLFDHAAELVAAPGPESAAVDHDAAPEVTPDTEVFDRDGEALTPAIGQSRMLFEAWTVAAVGDSEVLDTLRRNDSKEQVRALAAEIVDFEGPVHVDRLTGLIARSFGVGKLHAKRQKAIAHQLGQCDFLIDGDRFAWPEDLDPSAWQEFRPSSDPGREFLHVSPAELANAAAFLRARHPADSDVELMRRVLQTFGRKRLTKQVRAHLDRVGSTPVKPA